MYIVLLYSILTGRGRDIYCSEYYGGKEGSGGLRMAALGKKIEDKDLGGKIKTF